MQITQKDIEESINAIPAFFARRIKTGLTKPEFTRLQTQSADQLDGIAFLFLGHRGMTMFITNAKLEVLSQTFRQPHTVDIQHSIECLDEHCLGECITNSGDACRHSDQSPDAVGQSGTTPCISCNGTGINYDSHNVTSCDDCNGTGRQVFEFLSHDSACQCSSCQPFGPSQEPRFKLSKQEQVHVK